MKILNEKEINLVAGGNIVTEVVGEIIQDVQQLSMLEKGLAVAVGIASCFAPNPFWKGPLWVKAPAVSTLFVTSYASFIKPAVQKAWSALSASH